MIRPARVEDAAHVADIHNAIIAMTDPVVTFTTELRQVDDCTDQIRTRPFWVSVDASDRPLGFASYGPFRGGPGYARTAEHSVLLAPEARGAGRGRTLVETLSDHGAAAGLHMLVAGIGGENTAAMAFHLRLGFRETARMPQVGWKAGRWQTLVLMQKTLSGAGEGR